MTAGFAFTVALFVAALATGCDQGGGFLASKVASDFGEDCRTAQAPNEAMRKHLDRLCTCTEARIAATLMSPVEGGEAINRKVHAAMDACLREVGGAPGEGRNDKPVG